MENEWFIAQAIIWNLVQVLQRSSIEKNNEKRIKANKIINVIHSNEWLINMTYKATHQLEKQQQQRKTHTERRAEPNSLSFQVVWFIFIIIVGCCCILSTKTIHQDDETLHDSIENDDSERECACVCALNTHRPDKN